MKTPSRFIFLALATLAVASTAQAGNWTKPKPLSYVTNSLQKQVLSDDEIADILQAKRPARPVSDLELVARLGVKPPISNEGIPSLARPEVPVGVMPGVDRAVELIEPALKERRDLPMGERIDFLSEKAAEIIQFSGQVDPEILMRLTLNRSVDLINHVAPIAGRNPPYLARLFANHLVKTFHRAASYGNNNVGVTSEVFSTSKNTGAIGRQISLADFGRVHAESVLRFAQDPTFPPEARAIVLMRLLGYLGWDFNTDLLRREPPLARTITEIYRLQHSDLYRRILGAIADGQINDRTFGPDVAKLLNATAVIVESLEERLIQAGIIGDKAFVITN